jgi:copper chaperone CopZ
VRVALKSVNGVASVDVSLNKGLATVTLKPNNTVSLKQLQDAIAKNGFTTKQSEVAVRGSVISEGGRPRLQVLGTSEKYDLAPEPGSSINLSRLAGKQVIVEGVIPEAPQGKSPDVIRYRSAQEEAKQ